MWVLYGILLAVVMYLGPAGGLSKLVTGDELQRSARSESIAHGAIHTRNTALAYVKARADLPAGELKRDAMPGIAPRWLADTGLRVWLTSDALYVFGLRHAPGVEAEVLRLAGGAAGRVVARDGGVALDSVLEPGTPLGGVVSEPELARCLSEIRHASGAGSLVLYAKR